MGPSYHSTNLLVLINPFVMFLCCRLLFLWWHSHSNLWSTDEDDLKDTLDGVELVQDETKYVFFILNDSQNFESAGGSHWSTVLYVVSQNLFIHYDSMAASNSSHAKRLATALKYALPSFFNPSKKSPAEYQEMKWMPQQVNSYDCGVYAGMIIEVLTKLYLSKTINDDNILSKQTMVSYFHY